MFKQVVLSQAGSQQSTHADAPSLASGTASSVVLSPLQTEALQQLQKDSEAIRSQYAHYFDLSLVNNGVDETLKKLQEAFERACSSPQWVPVSWVY